MKTTRKKRKLQTKNTGEVWQRLQRLNTGELWRENKDNRKTKYLRTRERKIGDYKKTPNMIHR